MGRQWITSLLFFAVSAICLPLFAQEALRGPVVKITSANEYGEDDTGAGFVVGSRAGKLFLFTAAHVIGDPATIRVSFHKGPTVEATLEQSNAAVDIAVISCPLADSPEIAASFSVAKAGKQNLQPVVVIGHPLGNYWDLNLRPQIKSIEYDFDTRLFTLTPEGIATGNSGGPVLDLQYELLGLVTEIDQVKAVCVDAATLLKAMQTWDIPSNLMLGVEVAKAEGAGEADFRYRIFVQEANSAFAAGKWIQAKRAFEQADAIRPSEDFKTRIRQCVVEIAKDEAYARFMTQGKAAIDLEAALSFYQQAQQQRNTEEVRQIIQEVKEKMTRPGIPVAPSAELPQRYTDPFSGAMVLVEGGAFTMGCDTCEQESQAPAHQVYLDHFYIGAYEVTVEQFCQFLNERAHDLEQPLQVDGIVATRKGKNFAYSPQPEWAKLPVSGLDYCQIQNYCWWLGAKTGHVYRLPTEAEWEYAARGGKKSKNFVYAGGNDHAAVGWFRTVMEGIRPVGQKKPNELGLYDMSGNAWEWCRDWYDPDYYEHCKTEGTSINPRGPVRGERRVSRGGSHFEFPLTYRGAEAVLLGTMGFRLVREPYAVYAAGVIPADFFEQELALVEGGAFSMGSELGNAGNSPVHQVSLDDFYAGRLKVNKLQWAIVMGAHQGLDNCPSDFYANDQVVADWQEIDTFLQRLNALTGMDYRLLTEAEWEYAARGGKTGTEGLKKLGLYHMTGDQLEWCFDWYAEKYYSHSPARNPAGPAVGKWKVARGGDQLHLRYAKEPQQQWDSDKLGFRLARSVQGALQTAAFQDPYDKQMVLVKGGTVDVEYQEDDYSGTPKQYRNELTDFYLAQYEVTQAQWEYIMGVNPDSETPCSNCPVLNFETDDIKKFIAILNTATGKTYRLPTEAEWVWAAKGAAAGPASQWAGTDNELELYRYANYCDRNCNQTYEARGALKNDDGQDGVAPVGSYLPNALQLYDLTGNAAEMCHPPGTTPETEYTSFVVRGGSFANYPWDLVLSKRIDMSRYYRSTGFRLALTPGVVGSK